MPSPFVELDVGGRTVKVTNPDKVYFPARGETKLDLVEYFVAVGDGLVRALYERPCQLKRQPEGVGGEVIWQKRVPERRPEWIETAADLERRIPAFAFRYLVRPGITGWAQVHQGHVTGERDIRRKLEYDLYYAKNMSLALDLAITMLTIRTVLTGTGAK